jgi:PKD repeat protein
VVTSAHTYTVAGSYTASLVATDSSGKQAAATVGIGAGTPAPLNASLKADKTTGTIPLAVTFTGFISGGTSPYNWTLDYGDGTTPTKGAVPSFTNSHTYTKEGSYTAELTVTDSAATQKSAAVTINAGTAPPQGIIDQIIAWWNSLGTMEKIVVVGVPTTVFLVAALSARVLARHD